MATLKKISDALIKCDTIDLPENLVGAAVLINKEATAYHAAIFVRYRGNSKILHFTGTRILFEDVERALSKNHVYIFKYINFVSPILLPSFYNNCNKIEKYTKATYGFHIEPNAEFTDEGNFNTPNGFPPFMTCVGFCLYFIRGFIRRDLFYYDDWDINTIEDAPPEPLAAFFNEVTKVIPDEQYDEFIKNIRRIKPVEYLAAAYSRTIPIRKIFTDPTSRKLERIFAKQKAV